MATSIRHRSVLSLACTSEGSQSGGNKTGCVRTPLLTSEMLGRKTQQGCGKDASLALKRGKGTEEQEREKLHFRFDED